MKYVIATHNPGKLAELQRILAPLGIDAITVDGLTDAEETGTTFAENAYLKAALACKETGLPAVADDSGLCIDALGGEPGVRTARYAPVGQRKQTVLAKLDGLPREKRTARFVSAVSCVYPDGREITAEGVCEGYIGTECRGEGGFGYDPIFEVEDGRTFAELSPEEKDAISHRGVALRLFKQKLQEELEK
ncbi:MAG: RdgB/HAM1 family non-canonical purine NTP pyrophosphatase [Clostridia bacterium]|nr:RdgB/HAM1 family non-canonical purine NTP pyrophosphatase [Clostridia bacterium]